MKILWAGLLKAAPVLLGFGLLGSCASSTESPNLNGRFRSIEEALKGHNSGENRRVMHGLFEEGRAIIPALVNVLDSNVSASVLCGTNSLFFELVTVDFNAPFEPEDGHGGTVGEIALYLIESIIKDDIYFARTCSLEIDDEVISDSALVQKKIQAVASVLETLSSEELENLSAKDFDELMREHKLGFPQKKSEP